jgi:zinc protease
MATRQAVKASLASLGIKKIDSAAGIDEYRMRNGLKILLRENHSAPVVSFMLVYRVGSRNEAVGHTGSTHFLEHMMFKGTKKFNPASGSGVMETFSRVGALLNATTWLDRTNYYECVPSEYLQLCIQVEADRMRNLNLRQEDRDSEMTVVRNEFERGENNPGSALSKELTALAFREHPYHHPTIGWRTDVEYVPLERLKQFYDTYYWPDNATAIVVGDFDSDKTLRLIEKYFGKIPKSPKPIPQVYTVEPPQEGERRVELRRAGDLPQLIMGYHTPQADHKDTYALSVMQSVLGDSGKRSSRLYKALVEQGLATSCYASNGEFRDPFLFTLGATLAPGKTFEEVESVIYAEIEDICAITEKVKPDVFLSLHVNSSPGETKVSGLQTYFRTDHSRMLAHTVHATVIAKGTCADRRVFSGSLWVLRSPTIPSLLIESGYINCRFDRKRLLDSRYRLKLCDGIADGVTAFWQKKGLLKRKHA